MAANDPGLLDTACTSYTVLKCYKHFDDFIESGILSGRFSSASEAVREGLRLLEQREEEQTRIDWLRSAAREGVDAASRSL